MPSKVPAQRFRFGVFEVDEHSGELRKLGTHIKLNEQPFQVLLLLLKRPGETLTREEIIKELWPVGTFVDFDRGVNSAMNRLRDALGDRASNPRFIQTLARRGYRFIAPVQCLSEDSEQTAPSPAPAFSTPESGVSLLARVHELPITSHHTVQRLFLLLQLMYLGFYVGALANLGEIEDLLSPLPNPLAIWITLIVTAALLIPVRVFLTSAVLFRPPAFRRTFLRLWPFLLPFDVFWSLSPFLLLHHINYGVALACVPPLIYSPFAQRALILMGAGDAPMVGSTT
jgi:cholera toxin transcriptional activator